MNRIHAVIGFMLLLAGSTAAAAASPASCDLLTVAELEAALGVNGEQAISIRNKGTAREKQWTVPGAKLEQATVGKAICILSGRPSVASHSTCSIPRGEGYVEVDVIGDVGSLPALATVAALVQKAASRL